MHSREIQSLVERVETTFGKIKYYGSDSKMEHSIAFKLKGVNATFSVLTLDGKLKDTYDIQIEGVPPGDYVYTDEVSLDKFIKLVRQYKENEKSWP